MGSLQVAFQCRASLQAAFQCSAAMGTVDGVDVTRVGAWRAVPLPCKRPCLPYNEKNHLYRASGKKH